MLKSIIINSPKDARMGEGSQEKTESAINLKMNEDSFQATTCVSIPFKFFPLRRIRKYKIFLLKISSI